MSLINDALKRATQTPAASANTPPPAPSTPMQPVEYERGRTPAYFFPVLLAVLAGACWFIVQGVRSGGGQPITAHAREPQPAAEESLSGAVITGDFAPPPVESTPGAPIPNRNFSLDDSPAPAIPEGNAPAFKLQGVFYRAANPAVMINGKTVSVGGRIGAATVRAITRESVTLDLDGQTQVLTLEQ